MPFVSIDDNLGVVDFYTADTSGPGPFALVGTNAGKFGRMSALGLAIRGYDINLGGGEFITVRAPATDTTGQTISSITISGSTATVTTAAPHGLLIGAVVVLVNQVPAGYAGTFTVATVPSTTTFTYLIAGNSPPVISATTVGTYTNGQIMPGHVCQITPSLSGGAIVYTATPWAGTVNTGTPLCVALIGLTANQYGWFQVSGAAIVATAGAPAAGNPAYYSSAGIIQPTLVASKQFVNAEYATAVSQTLGSGTTAQTLGSAQAVAIINRPFAQSNIT